jgi:hypothetical protein
VGKVLNHELQDWLNLKHGVGSNTYREIEQSCRNGVTEGWLCQYEAGVSITAVHYGRIFKPGAELHGFSVDVVDVNDLAGPHHRHPAGEIDLVRPELTPRLALMIMQLAGWFARPVVRIIRALVAGGR